MSTWDISFIHSIMSIKFILGSLLNFSNHVVVIHFAITIEPLKFLEHMCAFTNFFHKKRSFFVEWSIYIPFTIFTFVSHHLSKFILNQYQWIIPLDFIYQWIGLDWTMGWFLFRIYHMHCPLLGYYINIIVIKEIVF